jgi:lipopolysaccharide biosynthesis glycosyltransferase
MARFLLCHRFGGIYLDADTLLLRDFEELFNWPGAFAYRWSRMVRTAEEHRRYSIKHRGSTIRRF